jgi:hypothetical protein
MTEGQIKIRIFIIRAIDTSFLLAVFALGFYAVRYSEHATMMGITSLVGLFMVNRLGIFSAKKIMNLKDQLKKIQQKGKRLV